MNQKQYSEDEVDIALSESVSINLISENSNQDTPSLLKLPTEAIIDGEEKIQLLEGRTYEYELSEGYQLEKIAKVVNPSRGKNNQHRGRIITGNYVGRLALKVVKNNTEDLNFAVEVRSHKADYRSDYRVMLQDITNECVDLLMQHTSPITQQVTVDHNGKAETLYQRFAFVKSIIDSNEFRDAVNRIIAMPKTHWKSHEQECDIRRVGRIGAKQAKQMGSRSDRIKLPKKHSLSSIMSSIPTRLTYLKKVDSLDTPENRFVKHALETFKFFCSELCGFIEKNEQNEQNEQNESKRPYIYQEAKQLEQKFAEYLSHNIFKEVQRLNTLPLNSPVLQRKEGYREVLRVWLMYDLAAKLVWKAPDNESYQVGKRDVATLYEYWLFFKLLRLIEKIFDVDPKQSKDLIEETSDGLGLKLRERKFFAVDATYRHQGRALRVKLSYNRTFGKSDYPKSGSWTKQMRPDYTLSIWPEAFSEAEAEEQELIVHVQFDAKYKMDGVSYLVDSDKDLDDEDNDLKERERSYKRDDLLKMHAYKDAIRRTVGAYVLYPGTKPLRKQGFHEVLPGLGAFPISPSKTQDNLEELEGFILEVVDHFCDRASQRERLSFHQYDIHKNMPNKSNKVSESIPEFAGIGANKTRVNPPDESSVLIAYAKKGKHQKWIEKYNHYNIRMDDKGLEEFGLNEASIKYLLLRNNINQANSEDIWQVVSSAPIIVSKDDLINQYSYPTSPSCDFYLLYNVKKANLAEFNNVGWDLTPFLENRVSNGKNKNRPFAISLSELSKQSITKMK